MDLAGFLTEHRPAILERWRQMIFDSYPPEAARFLRGERDRFHNPVGYTILRGTEVVFDGFVLGRETGSVAEALEAMVRLRAVQDYSPSQAVALVFWLRRVIRQHLREYPVGAELRQELLGLEDRIDQLALSAFDLYMGCRERIFEIRTQEIKRRTASLWQRLENAAEESVQHAGEGVQLEGGCVP
ncbi:MAG TPA: RsbRD N-terminal domain-containing protein [Vicinamibacteria bacterium]|nr:RsbRD N-terminal domain-containing protein [Vicinamibacteria bacterium]